APAGAAAPVCPAARRPPVRSFDPKPGAPRVFAIQFKQDPANVASYSAFARAVDCVMRREVVPYRARRRPNVVVFDEDIGLMTIATGRRGAAARALLATHGGVAGCGRQGFPCATLEALTRLDSAYAKPIAFYKRRFPTLAGLIGKSFVAATDVFVRGFMQTFSGLARRYGVYVVASNTQAPFRASSGSADIAALADPSLPRPRSVYVATEGVAYNQTFIWGPRNVRRSGPPSERNLLRANRKVPLTTFERVLGFGSGPTTGPAAAANLRPYRLAGTRARLGIATSLPAFVYGPPVAAGQACDDVTLTYMRCLSSLGANVMLQPDANDGAWTGPDSDPSEMWQPLSWMGSAWRAVSDPTVGFQYAVNPFLVGNLADTPFDGQSAILQRGLTGRGCNYVGNSAFVPAEDRASLKSDAGPKSEFLALAPWVVGDGPRNALRAVNAKLLFASGSPSENAYRQTAVVADLPFPANRHRRSCATR
ncbi:MAG: hypothetical protein ACR2ND_02535, partial [Solirubrobacteraceae bacterium]